MGDRAWPKEWRLFGDLFMDNSQIYDDQNTELYRIVNNALECLQTIFSINGVSAPLSPGTTVEFEMPDWYDRPWAAIWERYLEEGMSKPEAADLFSFD